eukprot:10055573-Prorocentrum_lima.AAC.1
MSNQRASVERIARLEHEQALLNAAATGIPGGDVSQHQEVQRIVRELEEAQRKLQWQVHESASREKRQANAWDKAAREKRGNQ